MNRRSRRTAVVALLACSVLASGGAALAPAAASVPAAASGSCTVRPADNGLSVTVSGSGWAPEDLPLKIDGGGGVAQLENVAPDGSFTVVRLRKSTDFAILPATGGATHCTVTSGGGQGRGIG
ncbi:hypothetical protein [Streptomyces sp. cmx-4-9]|uniref:hypothetical protein n=1 Tax=Streptomyces sp. cmx-4-9 TaxID=2790941 RepID=UPI00397F3610